MRPEDEDTIKRKKRKVFRRLKKKFNAREGKTPLLTRIINTYYGEIKFYEQYDMMLAWCEDNNEKPSLLRYNNWLRRALKWKKEHPDDDSRDELKKALDHEDQRSKERLREFRREQSLQTKNNRTRD